MNRLFIFIVICLALLAAGRTATAQSGESTVVVNPDAINFILMGDWGRNGEDHQRQVAEQMGKTAAAADIDFIVAAGDNFYPKGVASTQDPLWKYSYEDIYTAFRLQWDWHPVLGNHDYGSNPEAQVQYTTLSRRWSMPARYYTKTFSINGDTTNQLMMVFIDTTPLIPGYYRGTSHAVHNQDSTMQKEWIEKTLSSASANVKWKLVVGHHPMYTGGGRTESADTRSIRRLESMFARYNVDAYLAGHEHSLQHIGPVKKVHHFISGAASERTPARMLPISKFAASEYGFMLFSVTPSRIMIQVVDYTGKVLYTTTLSK